MKFRQIAFALTILALAAHSLVSIRPLQAQDTPEGFPLTVTDGADRELTFDTPPQRVVCLYNACMEAHASLGIKPIAFPFWSEQFRDTEYYPMFAEGVETIPLSGDAPDPEFVASLQPDLIIAGVDDVDIYSAIAPVFVEYRINNYQQAFDALINYALILNKQAEADAAIAAVEQRLEAYKSLVGEDRLSILIVGARSFDEVSIRTGNSTDCAVLNEIAQCAWDDPTGGEAWSYTTTTETVLSLNPDVIYMANWSDEATDELFADFLADPFVAETAAGQSGRVYNIPGYDNPQATGAINMTRLLDTFAPLIYPDIFPAPLTDEQVAETLEGETAEPTGTPDGSASFPITVTDGLGRNLTFDAAPQRIVCLNNGCIRALASLGMKPYALGEWAFAEGEEFTDPQWYPGFLDGVIRLRESEPYVVDPEAVAEVAPDLIVVYGQELVDQYTVIAPVYAEYDAATFRDTLENTRRFAQVFGRTEQAEQAIAHFEDRLAAYRALSPRNVTVMTLGVVSPQELWLRTQYAPDCSLLNEVAMCAWDDPTGSQTWTVQTSAEAILSLNPDIIYFMNWSDNDDANAVRELIEADPLLAETDAVKNGRIYNVANYDNTTAEGIIPGTRLLDTLMPLLYPEIFPEPLTDEQVQEIIADIE
jgi:iron complex transport system substrate-binding protein